MGDNLNISVLCAAKEEYSNQLKHYLTPLIQEGFMSIYEDANENDQENVLRQFQIYLKQIPRWNQTILEQETKRIKERCPFLMDLVTAIFVSHVKILASVRLGGNHGNIKIKIPTSEIFIHSIYVNSAEKIYYEPHPFRDLLSRKNVEIIKEIIDEIIEDTISSMIPIQSILQEYLSSAFSEHTKPEPIPDPVPEAPFERQFTGTDIVHQPIESVHHSMIPEQMPVKINPADDFGTMHNHFSIGDTVPKHVNHMVEHTDLHPNHHHHDTPNEFGAPPSPSSRGKIDLGETLEATSTGTNEDAHVDNSFGNAFSSDIGEPPSDFSVKSIVLPSPLPMGVATSPNSVNIVEDFTPDISTSSEQIFTEPSSGDNFFYGDAAPLE